MSRSPIKEWWVSLEGHGFDLSAVAEDFELSELCRIDLVEETYYLKSVAFNSLTDGWQVMAVAEQIVTRINGAMKTLHADFEPIKANGLTTLHENGNRGTVILAGTGHIRIRGGRATITVSGTEPKEPELSELATWFDLSEQDDNVADTLQFLSSDANWFDLYKAYEIISKNYKNKKEMINALSTDDNDKTELKRDVKNFTWTADTFRHARANKKPKRPMDIKEADKFIRDLALRFLRNLSHST